MTQGNNTHIYKNITLPLPDRCATIYSMKVLPNIYSQKKGQKRTKRTTERKEPKATQRSRQTMTFPYFVSTKNDAVGGIVSQVGKLC